MIKKYQKPNDLWIFIWNISGSFFNALQSVIIILIITRFLESDRADIFNIAWSISQLMATIGTYQIRMYQSTDVKERFSFRQYLTFRFITIGLMLIISIVYVWIKNYNGYKALIIWLLCVFRAIEALTEVFEGQFQQKERLDLVGKAITYRIIITTITFFVIIYQTRDLILACVCLIVCYVLCLFLYNLRYYQLTHSKKTNNLKLKDFINMIVVGAPLFINAFIMTSIVNEPKMILDKYVEQGIIGTGIQTIFGVLFLPASFLSLAYIVFRPFITRMAIVWQNGKINTFLNIMSKIFLWLLAAAFLIMIGSAFLGCPILSFVYGIDLTSYLKELLIIVLGGCLYTFAIIVDNAMIIMRKQHWLILAYLFSWCYTKLIGDYMFLKWGITGISIQYATSMGIFLIVTVVLFIITLITDRRNL